MAELLISFGFSFLGIMTNAYAKAIFSKRKEKFSYKVLLEENLIAFPLSLMGIIVLNIVLHTIPDVSSFIFNVFGFQINPDAEKPMSSFMLGFILYATLRNIFKNA